MRCYSHLSTSPKIFGGCCSVVLRVKLSKWGLENVSGVKCNEDRGEGLAAKLQSKQKPVFWTSHPFHQHRLNPQEVQEGGLGRD